MDNSRSSGSHRRAKKSNAGRIGLAGGLAGVLGIGAIAAAIVIVQHRHASSGSAGTAGAATTVSGDATTAAAPKTGQALRVATPDGYAYGVAAATGGTADQPLPKTETAPPSGSTYAYIDYVLTNTGTKPALLADPYPGDLFLPKSLVPAADQDRCMPQPGVKDGYCTLPNDSKIIAYLNGSTPPVTQNGSQFMPAGASYLVRVATNVPVSTTVKKSDLSLYVWQAVYIPDRKAVAVPFP